VPVQIPTGLVESLKFSVGDETMMAWLGRLKTSATVIVIRLAYIDMLCNPFCYPVMPARPAMEC
jgi:hypothetical protein